MATEAEKYLERVNPKSPINGEPKSEINTEAIKFLTEKLKTPKISSYNLPTEERLSEQFSIKPSQYDEGFLPSIRGYENLESFRSEVQPWYDQAANAVGRGLAGGLATAIENFSYLPDVVSQVAGNDWEKNAIAESMSQFKDYLQEELPIYRTSDNPWSWDGGAIVWESIANVLDSAVGFALPGAAVNKALGSVGKLGRLGKYANLLGGNTSKALNSLGSGFVLNDMEGTMMGMEIYETTLNDLRASNEQGLLDRIYTDEELKAQSAQAASKFKLQNRIFALTDAFAIHGIVRGVGQTRNLLTKPGFANRFKQMGSLSDNLLLQGLGEAGEEIGQGVFQQLAEQDALLSTGKDIDKKSAIDMALDPNTLYEGMLGFFGGGVQRVLMETPVNIADKVRYKQLNTRLNNLRSLEGAEKDSKKKELYQSEIRRVENQLKNTTRKGQYENQQEVIANTITDLNKTLKRDISLNEAFDKYPDDETFQNFLQDQQFAILANQNFTNGTTEKLESYLNDAIEGTAEGIQVTPEEQAKASELKERLKGLEKNYLKYSNLINGSHAFSTDQSIRNLKKYLDNKQVELTDLDTELRSTLRTLSDDPDSDISLEDIDYSKPSKEVKALPQYQDYKELEETLKEARKQYKKKVEELGEIISPSYQKKLRDIQEEYRKQQVKESRNKKELAAEQDIANKEDINVSKETEDKEEQLAKQEQSQADVDEDLRRNGIDPEGLQQVERNYTDEEPYVPSPTMEEQEEDFRSRMSNIIDRTPESELVGKYDQEKEILLDVRQQLANRFKDNLTNEDIEILSLIYQRQLFLLKEYEKAIVKKAIENNTSTNIITLGEKTYTTLEKEIQDQLSPEIQKVNSDATNFFIRDKFYSNLYSDPLQALNRDSQDNVASVSLSDESGKTVTFRGDLGQELAYLILLSDFDQSNKANKKPETTSINTVSENVESPTNNKEVKEIQTLISEAESILQEIYTNYLKIADTKKEANSVFNSDNEVKELKQSIKNLKKIKNDKSKKVTRESEKTIKRQISERAKPTVNKALKTKGKTSVSKQEVQNQLLLPEITETGRQQDATEQQTTSQTKIPTESQTTELDELETQSGTDSELTEAKKVTSAATGIEIVTVTKKQNILNQLPAFKEWLYAKAPKKGTKVKFELSNDFVTEADSKRFKNTINKIRAGTATESEIQDLIDWAEVKVTMLDNNNNPITIDEEPVYTYLFKKGTEDTAIKRKLRKDVVTSLAYGNKVLGSIDDSYPLGFNNVGEENNIEEVFGEIKPSNLVMIKADPEEYVPLDYTTKNRKEDKDLNSFPPPKGNNNPGKIYLKTKNNKGEIIPVKLNVKLINQDEAIFLYNVFNTLQTTGLSIEENLTPELVTQLEELIPNYREVVPSGGKESITFRDTIDTFIFFGTLDKANTLGKNSEIMYLNDNLKFAGLPQTRNIEAQRDTFIEWLTTTKRHQVKASKMYSNKVYREYILSNNILNTDLDKNNPFVPKEGTNKSGAIFVTSNIDIKQSKIKATKEVVDNDLPRVSKDILFGKPKKPEEITESTFTITPENQDRTNDMKLEDIRKASEGLGKNKETAPKKSMFDKGFKKAKDNEDNKFC